MNPLPVTTSVNNTADFKFFEARPGIGVILLPDAPSYTIVGVSNDFVTASGMKKEEVMGKSHFAMFPGNPADPSSSGVDTLRNSFDYVLRHKTAHSLPLVRYDIPWAAEGFVEKYWKSTNAPVFDERGEVAYLIHTAEDVTAQVKAEQRETALKSIEKAFDLFMHAPFVVGLARGENHVLEMANEAAYRLWGKGPEIIGKPLLESIPELKGQGILELFEQVKRTGQPYFSKAAPVVSLAGGKEEIHYYDLIYQPYYEDGSNVATGVFTISHEVTEQVVAQKRIEESERRFRALVTAASKVVYRMSADWSEVQELQGQGLSDTSEPIEDWLRKYIHPADQQRVSEAIRKAVATKTIFELEHRVLRGNGSLGWTFSRATPVLDDGGNLVEWFGAASDITQRKQTEEALRATKEETERQKRLYETITANTPDLIYVFDRNYRFTYANEALLTMWGKTWDEAIGKGLPENGYEPWHTEMHHREIDQVIATGQPIRGEVSFPHATLGKRLYDYIFVPVFNEQGEVEAIAGTTRDITEIRLAEQAVRKSESQLRTMILQAPVAMCILLGTEHVVDLANDAMIQLWGKPKELVMNRPIFEALPDARNQGLEKVMEDVYQTGVPFYAYEHPVELLRNGKWETVYQNFVYQPYRAASGEVLGVLAISVDVTLQVLTRKKVEESEADLQRRVLERTTDLEAANQELKRSNQNLEEFAYAASHDLKEPIRKIHFFADRLKGDLGTQLSVDQLHLFSRLEHASQRMSTLIDDLLVYSHVSRGATELEPVDLNKKVQGVLEDLEVEIHEKGAQVTTDPLPTVQGHKRQLQQLFQNLLSNALKYSKAGVAPHIHLSARTVAGREVKPDLPSSELDKTFYLLTVKDNGIGFPQADAERIFNVFTRLHGNSEYKGTGVGLSIVQKVVQNHGGHIWAESTPGEGATFYFLLPLR